MYYGIYKGIRNSAWKCLQDFSIDRLPVDVLSIAHRMNIRVLRNSDVNDLTEGENGRSYCKNGNWTIIYRDTNPIELSRFTLAHELGHILLAHELAFIQYLNEREFASRSKSEQQADDFAIRLLSPACILWALDLHSAEEIAAYCHIPLEIAKKRADRMKTLYKRNCFLSTETERLVFEQFSDYLTEQHTTKNQ